MLATRSNRRVHRRELRSHGLFDFEQQTVVSKLLIGKQKRTHLHGLIAARSDHPIDDRKVLGESLRGLFAYFGGGLFLLVTPAPPGRVSFGLSLSGLPPRANYAGSSGAKMTAPEGRL